MRRERGTRRPRWFGAAVAVSVTVAASVIAFIAAEAAEDRDVPPPAGRTQGEQRQPFDVLYRPPTFVAAGKPVVLTYDVVCPLRGPASRDHCTPTSMLYVRRSGERHFAGIALPKGRPVVATVPPSYAAGRGFDYFVQITDEHGNTRTVPPGGRAAPEHAWPVTRWTRVDLGRHRFGHTRAPQAVIQAAWGSGRGELGRERTVGASSFDVSRDGDVIVLDQLNRRLAVYAADRSAPAYTPIEFLGGEGDIAVAADGTVYVLDQGRATEHVPFIRSYGAALDTLASTRVGEQLATMVRMGPGGAIVHVLPSEQWLPVGRAGHLLQPHEQRAGALPARVFPTGEQVVVDAGRREARLALFERGRLAGSWLIRSVTPLGEVQLAERYRDGLVVALRVFNARAAEWRVLWLTDAGVAGAFAVRVVEKVDSTALSRLRRHGDRLYALESRRRGAAIVRYDLDFPRPGS